MPRRPLLWRYPKYLLAITIIWTIVQNEWLIYHWQSYQWNGSNISDTRENIKVLFIADPQIEGENSAIFPLNKLFIWDADRYLRKTYLAAVNYFHPNLIVFLGDLMDCGSVATDEEFKRYTQRIYKIFHLPLHQHIHAMMVPGDNDIGGENEPIRKDKLEKFRELFYIDNGTLTFVRYAFLSIYAVDSVSQIVPGIKHDQTIRQEYYTVVVSHVPITRLHTFAKAVNRSISPFVYFVGHDHKSKLVTLNRDLTHRETIPITNQVLDLKITNKKIHEIYVPPCSYRMGTSKIGFGAASFNSECVVPTKITSDYLKYKMEMQKVALEPGDTRQLQTIRRSNYSP